MSNVYRLRVMASEPDVVTVHVAPAQFAEQEMPTDWPFYLSALATIYACTRMPPRDTFGASVDEGQRSVEWPAIELFDTYIDAYDGVPRFWDAWSAVTDYVEANEERMAELLLIDADEKTYTATIVMADLPVLPVGLVVGMTFGDGGAWALEY